MRDLKAGGAECASHHLEGYGANAKPAVLIVGADKGGVGKTTVCRTLLDYFSARKVPIPSAFDTEAPKGTLKRFHPDQTDIVDVNLVPDQMRIFDTLSESQITMIDVRAGLLSPTLKPVRDIRLRRCAAKKGQITFAVFHILGPTIASLDEIAEASDFVNDAKYFLLKNFINNTLFFEWDQKTYDSYFRRIKDAVEVTIPKLNEMACEQVELAAVPFLTFIANKGANGEAASYSFVLRGYVRHWLGNVWGEFDRIRLIDVVSPKETVATAAAGGQRR